MKRSTPLHFPGILAARRLCRGAALRLPSNQNCLAISDYPMWRSTIAQTLSRPSAVGDVDGDGLPEIVFAYADLLVGSWRGNDVRWELPPTHAAELQLAGIIWRRITANGRCEGEGAR